MTDKQFLDHLQTLIDSRNHHACNAAEMMRQRDEALKPIDEKLLLIILDDVNRHFLAPSNALKRILDLIR